jgi:DNA-directed RNA polymerase sigma subunit (sigma70/sigma32)
MDVEHEQLALVTQLRADLIASLAKNLTPREARLMRLRYGLNDQTSGRGGGGGSSNNSSSSVTTQRSLAECADCMGLSQSRVQQLALRCLKKLRRAEEAESLQEYLLTIA